MLEATALPTVPQPLPNHRAKFYQCPRNVRNVLMAFLASIIQLEQVLRQKKSEGHQGGHRCFKLCNIDIAHPAGNTGYISECVTYEAILGGNHNSHSNSSNGRRTSSNSSSSAWPEVVVAVVVAVVVVVVAIVAISSHLCNWQSAASTRKHISSHFKNFFVILCKSTSIVYDIHFLIWPWFWAISIVFIHIWFDLSLKCMLLDHFESTMSN